MPAFKIDIGKSYRTTTPDDKGGNLATISFGGAVGYVIDRNRKTFQLVYMASGNLGIELVLTDDIEKELRLFFK